VSKEIVMSGDEMVKVEKFKIERFMALGLGRYEAIRAVEDTRRLVRDRGASREAAAAVRSPLRSNSRANPSSRSPGP
jgi:hypothetical protein